MDYDEDADTAAILQQRLGGALTVDDILILRAAAVWHRVQWELAAKDAADFGPIPGDEDDDDLSLEQQRALEAAGMLRREQDETATVDWDMVKEQLGRAEIAVGYLFSLYGIPAKGQPASYPSTDFEPGLGPTAVIEVWDRIARAHPELELEEHERLWTQAAVDSDEP